MKTTSANTNYPKRKAVHQSETAQMQVIPSSQPLPNRDNSTFAPLNNLSRKNPCHPLRLRIAGTSGFELLAIEDITHLEANGGVTHIYLSNGRRITAGRNLGYYETTMSQCGFCRVHHRFMANLLFIKQYHNADRQITLITGALIPVALQRTRDFLAAIEGISF